MKHSWQLRLAINIILAAVRGEYGPERIRR